MAKKLEVGNLTKKLTEGVYFELKVKKSVLLPILYILDSP